MKIRIAIIITLFLFFFSSCFDDLYYYFTDNERSLLVYAEGDTFMLQRTPEVDTLTFIFTDIIQDSLRTSALGLQYHNSEIYEASLEQDDYFGGGIFAFKEPTFEMSITLSVNDRIEFEGSLCDTLYNYTLNSKVYPELFVFAEEKGKNPKLYFTKDEGIVYIDSAASGNSYTLIEFNKME